MELKPNMYVSTTDRKEIGQITQNECLKAMIPKLTNIKGEEEKIGKLFKEMVYEMPKE